MPSSPASIPSGWFVYAAKATSAIVFDRSGAPFTENLPSRHSTSASSVSSRCAAIFWALARTLRATTAVAAPATGVLRDA